MVRLILVLLFCIPIYSQINFNDYFIDKTLRLDYNHTGDSENDSFSIDELFEEPFWGGSKVNLIDKFNFGQYFLKVFDEESNKMIYSRGYTTLFNEWQTTEEAKQTTKSFNETLVFPYPKNKVRVDFYGRDKQNKLIKKFEYKVDPENYFIKAERTYSYDSFDVLISGDPAIKVDIVFIPEGYTEEEMDQFKKDCEKFSEYLFKSSPYRENKNNFNIRGVLVPSKESGTDIPANDIWKNTIVNSRYYTFDLERYVMTSDNKTLRSVASNVPYDQICVIVNSNKYGGGAIYNHYSMFINENQYEEFIFVHEFGHGFASLADEYFTSEVAYEDFYSLDVEPLDPNLTTLVDFDKKWKNLVDEDIPIPTPADTEYTNFVGAFEGGGYVEKGVYRPMQDCTMKSIVKDKFCTVCKNAIQEMINFYIE